MKKNLEKSKFEKVTGIDKISAVLVLIETIIGCSIVVGALWVMHNLLNIHLYFM